MQIREALVSDARAIAKIHVDSWRSTYKGMVSSEYLDSISYAERETMWLKLLDPDKKTNKSFTFVACSDEKIVGFVSVGLTRGDEAANFQGEIIGIYILEKYQGMGLGKELIYVGSKQLLKEGINTMIVWVLAENSNATSFYQRIGVKPLPLGMGI